MVPTNLARIVAAHLTIIAALATGALAAAPGTAARPTTLDNSGHADANNVDMFVTNHGSFAWDIDTGNAGLIYPKGTSQTVVFAAGLWMGAEVGGSPRVTVAEYSQEYAPGPMAGGTFLADRPSFRVFALTPHDTTSKDYASWCCGPARKQGAPLRADGRPYVLGDKTLWAVYNDADPSYHTNSAGGTSPLGVQVSQLVYQYNVAGALATTTFLDFALANAGTNTLQNAFVSIWADPDVGDATDDLAGCDTTRQMAYAYNATDSDVVYGSMPPAVGFVLLQGVQIGASTTLGMYSANVYKNGTDPFSAQESFNYMRGLDANGSVVFDPTTNEPSRYRYTGDPVTGTGWLDAYPSDRRLMLSTGPFTFLPGETQVVRAAIIVAQGADRLASITLLRSFADEIRSGSTGNTKTAASPTGTSAPLTGDGLALATRPLPGGAASVSFRVGGAGPARLGVYDVRGRLVRTLVDRQVPAGEQASSWDGLDARGARVPSGVYILRLESAGYGRAVRLALAR